MALYRLTPGGVILTTTGTFIPEQPGSFLWEEYLVWAAGNTPDDVAELPLADVKATAQDELNRLAEIERRQHLPVLEGASGVWWMLRLREADLADVDGTPTAGEYPLLDAEIPETGADIAAVADAVLAEEAAVRASLAAIEDVRRTAEADIDAAADAAAVQAVLDAVVWP